MTSARVLLVEDEFLVRVTLAEMLRDDGFEVVEAENGDQAVSLIDGPDGFDALLTDVQMPGSIDGIRVVTHARQRHSHIPVIVVSAQSDHAQRVARLVPPGTFVSKPYDFYFLMKTLRNELGAKTT